MITLQDIQAIAKPLKRTCGVYLLLDDKKRIVYIGSSDTMETRIRSHAGKYFTYVTMIECNDKKSANALEIQLIRKFKPKHNIQFNPISQKTASVSKDLNGNVVSRNGTYVWSSQDPEVIDFFGQASPEVDR